MRELTYADALREALREEMLRDVNVILLGEEIGIFQGVYRVTRGLLEEFGPERSERHAYFGSGNRRNRRRVSVGRYETGCGDYVHGLSPNLPGSTSDAGG